MRKKISVEKLRIGMYLDGMAASWFKTPFLKHHFLIKDEKQINKIKDSGITHVYIDIKKGDDILSEEGDMNFNNERSLKKEDSSSLNEPPERDDHKKSQQENHYLQINKHTLINKSMIHFNLYSKEKRIINPSLIGNKDIEIEENILRIDGPLYIEHNDLQKYKDYLKKLVEEDPDLPNPQMKNLIIKENAKILMKEIFDDPRNGEKIKEVKEIVESIIESILNNIGAASTLLTTNKLDYSVYTHSVNVTVLSIGLAIALGIKEDGQLSDIAMGSLLHDIGKSTIPPEINNKPEEQLTGMELKILKQHVLEGYSLLKLFNGIPEGAFHPLLEHHERLSGKGYPYGLKGNEIHFSGRVVAIADSYDELTTNYSHKKGLSPYEALSKIQKENDDYDIRIFHIFVKMLGSIR